LAARWIQGNLFDAQLAVFALIRQREPSAPTYRRGA
jgi:hypothetical protein